MRGFWTLVILEDWSTAVVNVDQSGDEQLQFPKLGGAGQRWAVEALNCLDQGIASS